jgi:hypothetical protein
MEVLNLPPRAAMTPSVATVKLIANISSYSKHPVVGIEDKTCSSLEILLIDSETLLNTK